MKPGKVIRNVFLALLALVLVLLVTLQVLLRPTVLTGLVNRFAAQYVDGDLGFREVRAHVIKSFPFLNIEAEDLAVTYPHALFARYDTLYADGNRRFSLLRAGWQRDSSDAPVDTLLSARRIVLSLDYQTFFSSREVHLHHARLERPRIFAHYYDSTHANWHILRLGYGNAEADADTAAMPVFVKKVELADRPRIVYTNPVDTLYGTFSLRRLLLDGEVQLSRLDALDAAVDIDTLFVSGRLPQDTLALGVDHLWARAKGPHMQLEADARASLRTASIGRLRVPVHLEAEGDVHLEPALDVALERLRARFSALDLAAKGRIRSVEEGWDLQLDAHIEDCPIGELCDAYQENIPALGKVDTDARLTMDAHAEGLLGGGKVPALRAKLQIPPADVTVAGMSRKGLLSFDADLSSQDGREVDADISRLYLDIVGARIDASATARDVLGKDPVLTLDGTVKARVDSLAKLFTDGIRGSGSVDASLHGKARLSQLNMQKIGDANIDCDLVASDLSLGMRSDSLRAFVRRLDANLATKGNSIDRTLRKGARVLALKADMDSVSVSLNDDIYARGSQLRLQMQNAAEILKGGSQLTALMGILQVDRLRLRDKDGLALGLHGNTELFRVEPATRTRPTPRLTLVSRNEGIRMRSGANVYGFRDLKFDLTALKRQVPSGASSRMNRILDSLQRVYPGVPRDSLFAKARMRRLRPQPARDAFSSGDVNISLSGALREYVRDWDFRGNLALGSGLALMPAFPLRTGISDVKGSITNDTLKLDRISLKAGASDLTAQAQLTGLRRALIGRGRSLLKLDATVQSDFLDASELMRGYAYYTTYHPQDSLRSLSDEAVEAAVDASQLPDSTRSKLIIVPSNLEMNLTLESHGIRYDSLLVSWASADIAMRDRTLQITNALAASNMGDLYFEGFYCTHSRDDIRAGFDLNMVDITAEKVITLLPAVDTILPMLTSFGGDLDCELTATADIDTNMNLVLPTIDGIMKISGKDLTLRDSEEFSKIAGMLMFQDKKKAVVDNMAVTGMIRDNTLEVFPFVLDVDRYTVAASGLQYLDASFSYHLSVIRSPLLFKFGLNAWGADFDHIKYALTRPRYKDANVPVFTRQLDTVQYSLVAAIHNIFELGVERAIAQNNSQHYIEDRQEQLGWTASDTPMEEEVVNIRTMSGLLEDVAVRVAARREALRQEILRLEEELARRNAAAAHSSPSHDISDEAEKYP